MSPDITLRSISIRLPDEESRYGQFWMEQKVIPDMMVAYRPPIETNGDVRQYLLRLRTRVDTHVRGDGLCVYEKSPRLNTFRVTCCYPVNEYPLPGDIPVMVLTGGTMLSAYHRTDVDRLGRSWERLYDFIEASNIPVVGARREVYRGLTASRDESVVVELQVPVNGVVRARFL